MTATKIRSPHGWFFIVGLVVFAHWGFSQENDIPEPSPKAARYYQALQKRPESEPLFNRLVDAWLETQTLDELGSYLLEDQQSAAQLFIYSRYLLRVGDDQRAIEVLDQAAQKASISAYLKVIVLQAQGELLFRLADFDKAIAKIDQAIAGAGQPDSQVDLQRLNDLRKRKGQIMVRTNRRAEGLKVWQALLEQAPDDPYLRQDVVRLLTNESLFDEAISQQQKLIALAESKKDAYTAVLGKVELGNIYRRANNWSDANKTWQSALPATGHNTWIEREILGLVEAGFRRADNLTGLRQVLAEMAELEPKRLSLQLAQARLYADLNEDAVAIKQWQHLLELTPGDLALRADYVRALAQLERPAQAAEQMSLLIELQPGDVELLFKLAELQYQSDQLVACGESLLKFLSQSDGSEYIYHRVARQMSRYELNEAAENVYIEMIEKFPDSVGASDLFANFLYDIDRKKLAIERWRKLGGAGDLNQLLKASSQLEQRFETKACFELLKSRLGEFDRNTKYLTTLCQVAIIEAQAEQAIPWARQAVELSTTAGELDQSLTIAMQVASRLPDGYEPLKATLASAPQIATQCFYALVLDADSSFQQATDLLNQRVNQVEPAEALFPLLTLVKIYQRNNRWNAAAETMERVVTQTPGGRKSNHISRLVGFYRQAFRPKKALYWAREWKQLSPGTLSTWMLEARMLEEAGRIKEALQVMRSASQRFENDKSVLSQLSNLYLNAGYPQEAEKVLWKGYEQTDDQWVKQQHITKLARLSEKTGRSKQLIENLENRKRSNSNSISTVLSLAEVYRVLKKDREYRETLYAAVTHAPDNLQLVHQVANLDVTKGDYDGAIRLLSEFESKDTTGRTANRIAQIYMIMGRVDLGMNKVVQLPSSKRPSILEIQTIALTAMSIGEWQAAADFLELLLEYHVDQAALHYLHAIAQLESGNYAKARKALLSLLSFQITAPGPKPGLASRIAPFVNGSAYGSRYSKGLVSWPDDAVAVWQQSLTQAQQMWDQIYISDDQSVPPYFIDTSGIQRAQITLPSTSTQLRAFTINHLFRLAALQAKAPSTFRAEVVAAGLSGRDFDLALQVSFKQAIDPDQLYLAYSNDPAMATWYLSKISGADNPSETRHELIETALNLIERTEGSAMAARAAYLIDDDEKTRMFIRRIEEVTIKALEILCAPIENLEEDDKVFINQMLAEWLESENAQEYQRGLSVLLGYYARESMPEKWIECAIAGWTRSVESVQASPGIRSYLYTNHSRSDRSVPGFLPGKDYGVYNSIFGTAIPEGLREHLQLCATIPDLYYLLSSLVGNVEDGLRALAQFQQRLDNNQATQSELYLLAYSKGASSAEVKAALATVNLLRQVREMSVDPNYGTLIDLDIWHRSKLFRDHKEMRDLGVEAALRLRLDLNVNRVIWSQVARSLSHWGMSSKATRPSRVVAAANQLALSQSNHHYAAARVYAPLSGAPSVTLTDLRTLQAKVNQLIKAKNNDAAITLLKCQLPIQASRILSKNASRSVSQFDYLRRGLAKANLIPTLLEKMKPAEDARHLDKVRYASACEVLGERDQALQAYQQLIKGRPDDAWLRLGVIRLLAADKVINGIDVLREVAFDSDGRVVDLVYIHSVFESLRLQCSDLRSVVDLAEAMLPILKLIDSSDLATNSMSHKLMQRSATQIWSQLGYSFREGEDTIPALIERSQSPDLFGSKSVVSSKRQVPAEYIELDGRRAEIYQDLCLYLMKVDNLGGSAFSSLVKIVEQRNSDREIVLGAANDYIDNCIKNGSGGIKTAAYWLIDYAYDIKKPELVEDLRDRLEQIPTPLSNVSESVNLFADLYFCQPKQFRDKVWEALGVGDDSASPQLSWAMIDRVLKLRTEDAGAIDTKELSIIVTQSVSNFGASAPDLVRKTAIKIATSEGGESMIDFLDEIDKALKKRQFKDKSSSDDNLILILNGLTDNPVTSYHVYQFAAQRGWGARKNLDASPDPFRVRYRDDYGGQASFLEFWSASDFGADLDNFDVISFASFPHIQDDKARSLASKWLHLVKRSFRSSSGKGYRRELTESVRQKGQSASFGVDLVVAALSDSPDQACLDVFFQYFVEIQGLPKDRQQEFCQLALDLIGFQGLKRSLTRDERDMLIWMGQTSGDRGVKKLDLVIDASSFTEMGCGIKGRRVHLNEVTSLIRDAFPYNWQKSFAAFENTSRLGEAAIQKRLLDPSSASFTQKQYHSVVHSRMPVESFAFTLATSNSDVLPPVYFRHQFVGSLKAELMSKKTADDRLGVMRSFLLNVKGQCALEEMDCRAAIPIFYSLCSQLSSQDCEQIYQWSKSDKARQLFPVLSPLVEAGFNIRMAKTAPSDRVIQVVSAGLAGPGKHLADRLSIGGLVSSQQPMPEPWLKFSMSALAEAWASPYEVPLSISADILNGYSESGHIDKSAADWDAIRSSLAEAFHRRFLNKEMQRSPYYSRWQRESVNQTILMSIIAIHVECDNSAAVNQIIAEFSKILDPYVDSLFAMLVEIQQHESAANLLRTRAPLILKRPFSSSQRFGPSQAEAMETFLDSLEDSDESWLPYLAKVILCSMRDPRSGQPKAEKYGSQMVRMKRLAESFSMAPIPLGKLREATLNYLYKFESARDVIFPMMAEGASNWSIGQLAAEKDSVMRRTKLDVYSSYMGAEILKGNFKIWQDAAQSLGGIRSSSVKKECVTSTSSVLEEIDLETLSEKEIGKLIPLFYQQIEDQNLVLNSKWVLNLIKAHLVTGTQDDFSQRASDLSPGGFRKLQSGYSPGLIVGLLRKEFNKEQNRDLWNSLLSEAQFAEFELRAQSRRDSLLSRGKRLQDISRDMNHLAWRALSSHEFMLAQGRPWLDIHRDKNRLPLHRDQLNSFDGPLGLSRIERQRFLAAETLKDVECSQRTAVSKVIEVMIGQNELRYSRAIFDHGSKLIRDAQQSSPGWHTEYYNGWSPVSKILTKFAMNDTSNWYSHALLLNILWHETPRDFVYASSNEYNEQTRFASILKVEGGLYWPKQMLEKHIDILTRYLDEDLSTWGDTSGLLPQFFESCEEISNPYFIAKFISAAEEIWSETKNPIAIEFAMAGRICLEAYHHEYYDGDAISEPQSWIPHSLDALENSDFHLAGRLGLARFLTHRLGSKCPDSITMAAAQLVATGLHSEQLVSGDAVARVLRLFNQMDRTEAWQQVATEIISGYWKKSLLDHESTKYGRAFAAGTDTVLAMLELALLVDDDETVSNLMVDKLGRVSKSPRAFALLVRHGQFELAHTHFENHSSWDIKDMDNKVFDLRFDNRLEKQTPRFLKQLESDEERFFANLYLNGVPDQDAEFNHWLDLHPALRKQLGLGDIKPRYERLRSLAKQVDSVEFSSNNKRSWAIYQLSRDWRVASSMDSVLANQFESEVKDVGEVVSNGKNPADIDPQLVHLITYSIEQISQSNSKPFQTLVEELNRANVSRTAWSRRYVFERCIGALNQLVEDRLLAMDNGQLKALSDAYGTVFKELKMRYYHRSYGEGLFLQIVVSALLDEGKSLRQWREENSSASSNLKALVEHYRVAAPHVLSRALHLEGHQDAIVSNEQLWAVSKALLSDPWMHEAYIGRGTYAKSPIVLHFLQHHGLNRELMSQFDDQIAESWPQYGWVAIEIAEYYAHLKNWEKAKQFVRKALSQLGQDEDRHRLSIGIKAMVSMRRSNDEAFLREMIKMIEMEPGLPNSTRGIMPIIVEIKAELESAKAEQ